MPDRDVQSIRDLIYYQYAKLIARSAFSESNGKSAKAKHYGFIKNTFRDLKAGRKLWSDIMREDWQLVESDERCSYCGRVGELHREHIVPKSLAIKPECTTCHRIQDIHNQVWGCKDCNSKKGTRGLYEYFRLLYPDEKKFFDFIPPLVEKKYLKTIYCCHECAGTLEAGDLDGDGEITVLDVDQILH
ncbi:MAG: HNH endonuclease [Acidobacteriota bacterium]